MIPLATTTVTVMGHRPQIDDPETTVPLATLATGLRACISSPAFKRHREDTDELDIYNLRCDPFELNRFDIIIDEQTGIHYEVESATPSLPQTWGMQHTVAYIRTRKGLRDGRDLGYE